MAKHSKKKKKQSSSIPKVEGVTPERRKQMGGVTKEVVDRDSTGKVCVKRFQAKLECVLDYYWRTKKITDEQRDAGVQYREIYLRVNNGPACKIFDSPFLSGNPQDDHEWRMLAHVECVQKLDAVRQALTAAQDRVILQVCGHDQFASSKDDKETLQRGLQNLADFIKENGKISE